MKDRPSNGHAVPRRWTILITSNDTDATKSYTVGEGLARAALAGGVTVALLGIVGLGTVIARLSPAVRATASRPATPALSLPTAPAEVVSLRGQVAAIRGVIDTIRAEERRLAASIGTKTPESSLLLKRLLGGVPRLFGAPRRPPSSPSHPLGDTVALRLNAQEAIHSADSLLTAARSLALDFRSAGPPELALDSLDVLFLRPESLSVAATAARGVTRANRAVKWLPKRRGALLAGGQGEVSRVSHVGQGVWRVEVRAAAGLVSTVEGYGLPLVRVKQRVVHDQPVFLVSPGGGDVAGVRYSMARNGVTLDPAVSKGAPPVRR